MSRTANQSKKHSQRLNNTNYEETVQKQLHDDFQIFQHLGNNYIEGVNMEEYMKLINTLSVVTVNKQKKKQALRVNLEQMTEERIERNITQVQIQKDNKEAFLKEYQSSQIKLINEIEIQNTLQSQIIQTEKSLILIKGDISHMIARNQATKFLESKMSKVKIVAGDQYKRVNLASTKDKEEIKIRSEMQRNFKTKMKNVSKFEENVLKKYKKVYIDTMVKKKRINDKLNQIEKVRASIDETCHIEWQKNLKNKRTLVLYGYLVKVSNLIGKVKQIQQGLAACPGEIKDFSRWLKDEKNFSSPDVWQFPKQSNSVSRMDMVSYKSVKTTRTNIPNINCNDLEAITSQKLQSFRDQIILEFHKMKESVEKNTQIHNIQMKKYEQMVLKLDSLNKEIDSIQESLVNQYGKTFLIKQEGIQAFNNKMKGFQKMLKTIFVLLEFLQKSVNYSALANQEFNRLNTSTTTQDLSRKMFTLKHVKSMKDGSNVQIDHDLFKKTTPVESRVFFESERSISANIIYDNKCYVTELHKNYHELSKEFTLEDNHLDSINAQVFSCLQQNIEQWLQLVKQHYIDGKQIRLIQSQTSAKKIRNQSKQRKLKKNRTSPTVASKGHYKKKSQATQEDQIQEVKQQADMFNTLCYQNFHMTHQDQGRSKSTNPSFNIKTFNNQGIIHNHGDSSNNKIANIQKLKNVSQTCHKQAQRVQLLSSIDKDYYKMLKSTFQMEKQTTKKNYQFLSTFKRAKFFHRDSILQQKRFETSFSMLFSNKKANQIRKSNYEQKPTNKNRSLFFKRAPHQSPKTINGKMPVLRFNSFSKQQVNRKPFIKGQHVVSFKNIPNSFKQSSRSNKENVIMKERVKPVRKQTASLGLGSSRMKELINLV